MKKLFYMLLVGGVSFFFSVPLHAQNGIFNLRFNIFSYDEMQATVLLDIEVKAASDINEFQIADQNYRFSFDPDVIPLIDPPIEAPETNPLDRSVYIYEELELSSIVFKDGTASFFDEHTLTGSNNSLISVNIPLAGGDGTPVYNDTWVKVSRLELDIVPGEDTLCLTWHDPTFFPETVMNEKFNGSLFQINAGSFENICAYLPDYVNFLAVDFAEFAGHSRGCKNLLTWSAQDESTIDHYLLERSFDGINFESIAQIQPTASDGNYELIDGQPWQETYYRVIAVGKDEKTRSSELVVVYLDCTDQNSTTEWDIFPNPSSNGQFTLRYSQTPSEDLRLEVVNMLGQSVHHQVLPATSGNQQLQVDLGHLENGLYQVLLYNERSNIVGAEKICLQQ